MNIIDVSFVKHSKIERLDDGSLGVSLSDANRNHLGEIAAGAQFGLAEAASAEYLINKFPNYADIVLPLLRSSVVEFCKSTKSNLRGEAFACERELTLLASRLQRNRIARISVNVSLFDERNEIVLRGVYKWIIIPRKE